MTGSPLRMPESVSSPTDKAPMGTASTITTISKASIFTSRLFIAAYSPNSPETGSAAYP